MKYISSPRRLERGPQLSVFIIIAFVILFLIKPVEIKAEPVSDEQAGMVVLGWLKTDARPLGACLGRDIKRVETYSSKNSGPLYYVVYLQPEGFVIVPADDMLEPIIAFAPKGIYEHSPDKPLGALVESDIPARLQAVRELQQGIKAGAPTQLWNRQIEALENSAVKAQDKWAQLTDYADSLTTLGLSGVSDERVPPIIQSVWGQTTIDGIQGNPACYNYYTPPGPDGSPNNYPCGCTATATAQLIRYHEYGTGSYSWDDMPLDPNLNTTEPERQAIGELCFDVSEAIDTTYGETGSTASLYDASEELRLTFGYDDSIYFYENSGIMGSLNDMANPNLDAEHPVLLGLSRTGGGHSVVCDGYGYNSSTLYHHLNMGWDGNQDAWYNLPTVDSSPYSYDTVDTCVYNVFTSESGEIISGRVIDMAGNPIPDTTITAETNPAGTFQTNTNQNGIYALLGVPSNEDYTVTASKSGHAFNPQNVSTGSSQDGSSTSGNLWGIDFQSQSATPPTAYDDSVDAVSGTSEPITLNATDEGYPDPPGELSYIITSLPNHGRLTDPHSAEILTVPYTLANNGNSVGYWPCTYFAGQDSFKFKADDSGEPPIGGESNQATITLNVDNNIYTTFEPSTNTYAQLPMHTSYHDSRTQVIYLAGDIGEAKTLTDLALNIYQSPGQTLNNWTIRMKHTTLSKYVGYPEFETTGWTVVYQNNEPAPSSGWQNFHFQTPFEYNGTDNLMIDFSHNNTYATTNGYCFVSDTGETRVVMQWSDSSHGDPLDWGASTFTTVYTASAVPNLKLIGTIPADPIAGDFEPDCDVDFKDFGILGLAWNSGPGDENWNQDCDIYNPPDNFIGFSDLDVLLNNWLTSAAP